MLSIFFPGILFLMVTVPPLIAIYYDGYFTKHRIDVWENFTSDGGPWCEKYHKYGLVKEKSNAYSDYIFLLTGTYLLSRAFYGSKSRDKENLLKYLPRLSYFYAFINLLHGVGTFINHSCRCSFGHRLDLIGMFSITNFWIPYYFLRFYYYKKNNVYLNSSRSHKYTSLLYKKYTIIFILLSILSYPFTLIRYDSQYSEKSEFLVLGGGCMICLTLDAVTKQMCKKKVIELYFIFRGNCLYVGSTIIVLGAILHKFDIHKVYCDPTHFIQLHAVWHVCAAVTTVIAYEHAISEFPYYMNLPFIKTFPIVKSP